jgi:hypothetical protein
VVVALRVEEAAIREAEVTLLEEEAAVVANLP